MTMTKTLLAGDIGGTKTNLLLALKHGDGALQTLREATFPSGEFDTFEEILDGFLKGERPVDAACFGLAGPVVAQRCQTTNLPWLVDGVALGARFGFGRTRLLNDLEAMALGMPHLPPEDLIDLNPDGVAQPGNIAVIAAGTGLGEAVLYWDGEKHHPMATEGGHCDFSPQTDAQVRLLNHLRQVFPDHVSWERLLSGPGFGQLYDFLVASRFAPSCPAVPAADAVPVGVDRNAVISRLGVGGEDPLCAEVVRWFAELYGSEAGNLALKSFATGGLYIGGGIGPKIRSALESGEFLQAFVAKGRFKGFLSRIPVKLALNPRTPLLGALHYFD